MKRKLFFILKSIPYIKICPCIPSLCEDMSGRVVGGEVLDVPDVPGHGVAVALLCWYVCLTGSPLLCVEAGMLGQVLSRVLIGRG